MPPRRGSDLRRVARVAPSGSHRYALSAEQQANFATLGVSVLPDDAIVKPPSSPRWQNTELRADLKRPTVWKQYRKCRTLHPIKNA